MRELDELVDKHGRKLEADDQAAVRASSSAARRELEALNLRLLRMPAPQR